MPAWAPSPPPRPKASALTSPWSSACSATPPVVDAYLRGLEQVATTGVDLTTVRSVASLCVSRVDTETDARLNTMATVEAQALRGKSGIANARLAPEHYEAVIA